MLSTQKQFRTMYVFTCKNICKSYDLTNYLKYLLFKSEFKFVD
jgi:hypothetical protein